MNAMELQKMIDEIPDPATMPYENKLAVRGVLEQLLGILIKNKLI